MPAYFLEHHPYCLYVIVASSYFSDKFFIISSYNSDI